MPPMKPNIGALSVGLAAAAVWGGMYAVSKVVLETIPPFALLSLRLTPGFLSLAAAAAFRGGLRLRRGELPAVLAAGAVGYGLSLGFQFLGTKLSAASTAAMVTSATPALVLPFAALILGERATARKVLALAVATAGVLLVVDPWRSGGMGPVADGGRPLLGNFLLVGAAAAWALYSVLVRRLSRGADLLSLSAVMLLGGLPSSLALGAVELAGGSLGPIHSSNAAGFFISRKD